jgi:hypothetical protein
VPSDAVSPTFSSTSATVPPNGAGTSIVALSVSSVISGSFSATSSPGATWTSTTATSVKPPMSGIGIKTGFISGCLGP